MQLIFNFSYVVIDVGATTIYKKLVTPKSNLSLGNQQVASKSKTPTGPFFNQDPGPPEWIQVMKSIKQIFIFYFISNSFELALFQVNFYQFNIHYI